MSGFIDDKDDKEPSAFIQWKGTDVCMDFYCDCGAHGHFDGYFAYEVQCQHCRTVWEMPCTLYPRKTKRAPEDSTIQQLEPDEDYSDEVTEDGMTRLEPRMLPPRTT